MIDRRQFFRRFGGAAVSVAIAPLEAFQRPELAPWAPVYGKPFVEALEPLQAAKNLQISDLSALIHEIYSKAIVSNVRMHSPMMKIFDECPEYPMAGEKLVFGVDLKYPALITHMENDHGEEEGRSPSRGGR
jgi:hypothetical protein